ncbi:Zinc finger and SCAN domain-containing protein 5B [Melipona quadrifasciata]|uniref:Zinc finger and SCAN domain-containing protein 5B n=1 Tax=Melipona quadrifasciata TaxID=166423 RepID=A0A0M9AAL5_9HYME|nr:Zinc finger and SCAN domain-containing protein 5B [Melipona quadrifasciata]
MCNESLENIYQNTMQDNEQCKEVDINKEKIYFVELNNSESVNVYYNATKQNISLLNRTSRTVPNILKSNSRLHRIFKTDAAKSDCFFDGIADTKQVLVVASEHTMSGNTFAKEIKHKKVSRRRKQKLNYVNTYHEPNWNIFSFVDKEKEMLDKNISMSTELKNCTQEKELKHHTNKQDKKQGISVLKNDQERSSMSDHTLTDFTSECQIFSSFEEIDSNNLQESIDFSSNEIFNKFNYEFYNGNNLDCCTKYIENSDNTYNSFNTKYDSNYIKEYDINDNKIDTSEALSYWSLTDNEQGEIDVSIKRSIIASEYWNADLSNKKSKCSSNSCCDHCLEDCVSNWIATSGASMFRKDRLLTETFNDDSQVNWNNSDLHISNGTYLTDNEDNTRTLSPVTEIENSLQVTDDINPALTKFLNYSNEKGIKGEIFKEKTDTEIQEENNVLVKNLCVKNNKSKNIKKRNEFQCLSCSLTFSSARTMAMHQAGAHGGMYIILCESCGRLFNRKYNFNRHFIHCGRTKEPFKCDMCFRKYRHKSSLVHHLKKVHDVRYACSKKFTCTVCQKVYSKFGSFQNHVKSHRNAQ